MNSFFEQRLQKIHLRDQVDSDCELLGSYESTEDVVREKEIKTYSLNTQVIVSTNICLRGKLTKEEHCD